MNPQGGEPAPSPALGPAESRVRRAGWRKAAGTAVGVAVLAAAVWAVASQRETLDPAWASLRAAPAWLIAALIVLPLGNLAATAGVLTLLNRRHGRVGWGEMTALVASAWLLNYLPLRPGLVGRVTYHRLVNAIPIKASIGVLMEAIACGAGALAMLVAAGAAVARIQAHWSVLACAAVSPGLLVAAVAPGLRGRSRARAWALAVRYLDTLMWVARYMLVFRAIGVPVSFVQAAGAAAVSQVVLLVPIVGNGLGLREWAVGAVAAVMPVGRRGAQVTVAAGLAADLVNRALELAAAIPAGLVGVAWLSARVRRARVEQSARPGVKAGAGSAEPSGGRPQ